MGTVGTVLVMMVSSSEEISPVYKLGQVLFFLVRVFIFHRNPGGRNKNKNNKRLILKQQIWKNIHKNEHYLSLLLRPGLTILLFISGLVVHSFFKFNFQFPREKLNFTKWKLGMNDGCGGWEIICNVIFMFQIRN